MQTPPAGPPRRLDTLIGFLFLFLQVNSLEAVSLSSPEVEAWDGAWPGIVHGQVQ